MLREGFESEFEVTREEFTHLALSSISLNYKEKFRICNSFDTLSNEQISELTKVWLEERDTYSKLLSQELYSKLIEASNEGKSDQITEDIPFLESLKEELTGDWSLYSLIGNAYDNKEEYDNAIEAYQKAIEINPKKDEAYYNMGIAYYSLGQFDEVIKALSMALHINPNNSSAYSNLFELQLTQNQAFDQELEKKYLERFQDEKETFIAYEMLKILQNISHKKEVNVEQWKQKYEGVSMGGWSFDELGEWIDEVEDTVLKARLQEALEVFKGHG
jgi:tetratricopeptide (TPR) repeat protein